MPPPSSALPSLPRGAPLPPRGGSEASFGPGREPSFASSRPVHLRSKFSSTRLRSAYDQSQNASTESMPKVNESGYVGDEYDGHASRDSATTPTPRHGAQPPLLRMRSASQPSVYVPVTQQPPPPMPRWNGNGSASSLGTSPEEKRGSGSSESTNISSEYSPTNTQSPITPFGDKWVEREYEYQFGIFPHKHAESDYAVWRRCGCGRTTGAGVGRVGASNGALQDGLVPDHRSTGYRVQRSCAQGGVQGPVMRGTRNWR
ncbi:hypothetical protein RSAG8_03736, partial [Rhizoctonia solani AG-8 WAC10335]